jgi:hypothetical protein
MEYPDNVCFCCSKEFNEEDAPRAYVATGQKFIHTQFSRNGSTRKTVTKTTISPGEKSSGRVCKKCREMLYRNLFIDEQLDLFILIFILSLTVLYVWYTPGLFSEIGKAIDRLPDLFHILLIVPILLQLIFSILGTLSIVVVPGLLIAGLVRFVLFVFKSPALTPDWAGCLAGFLSKTDFKPVDSEEFKQSEVYYKLNLINYHSFEVKSSKINDWRQTQKLKPGDFEKPKAWSKVLVRTLVMLVILCGLTFLGVRFGDNGQSIKASFYSLTR